ncbi:hypothetical protein CONPUDRAFT_165408 [Coniophora puteana RWD-64-598 SS2]|uniref:F-box domain-containing protein n=1 Tax=Coniophora puteana (strain RWD-64-598) TaxID=741705 RepID=A0A5M3MQ63_CONPW|nr:uncharacterized protein CONPUDRAFT_165408 [Coniophora puteana RWD-64-598 SS2]EIW81196.1 hypothetical protein CONPUDRAFT_165408 [Coniophora puteana RWD-64-598 SS2]
MSAQVFRAVRDRLRSRRAPIAEDHGGGPSNSELHVWLRIPHILDAICAYVNDDSSLARLARVCRAFNEPALSVLYAHIEDILLFLQCLPRDLWTIKGLKKYKKYKELRFRRKMTQRDWDIFAVKAARVKALGPPLSNPYRGLHCAPRYDNDPTGVLFVPHDSVLDALTKRPIPILFPNLRVLTGALPNPLFSALLSPQLRHLDVTHENMEVFLNNEPSLPVLCPSIESLHILTFTGDVEKPFPTPRFIPQWSSLRSLTGSFCVDSALLDYLRGCQNLDKLELFP